MYSFHKDQRLVIWITPKSLVSEPELSLESLGSESELSFEFPGSETESSLEFLVSESEFPESELSL